jgi:N,N'-diacetyllegionaminate synthase
VKSTIIIAEAGVNHNGDLDLARQLIDVAADAGADYVKFQSFKTEKIVSPLAKKAEYQKQNLNDNSADSQFEMLKKLELSIADHEELIAHCKKRKIKFLSTAFDHESLDLLRSLDLDLFKIPSGEITNLPYLRKVASLKKPVIVSTGMCTMDEIKEAVKILVDGGVPRKEITVLHCTTAYPTPMQDVNLKAMVSIQNELNISIGYSDHTAGIEVSIAAVALGATIIEKHFTTDRNLPGPDHKASLEPDELKNMVASIRNIEIALGDGEKKATMIETQNMKVARKSIHLNKTISKGSVITESDLEMLRPGDGISPMELEKVVGKKIRRDLSAGSKLAWEDLT